MEKLRDQDVREVLLEFLSSEHRDEPDTRIINELGIDFGASRVDVAVVNGILHGYEIKSESDNLKRLPKQMEYYNRLFERVTIVVDEKYYDEVKVIVPNWWGITTVKKRAGEVKLISKRKGRKQTSQDKELLLKLLWKDELEKLVDVLGYSKKLKRLTKSQLLDIFAGEKDIDVIKNFVYTSLKTREFWRK
ncbi:sce7726 family protein [Brevibacillus thermoruber]|uniref:Sce7726 family protein n=1 Tax=Brevibacillus thermoruber TaxID=33942 RepID=A0A9X3TV50_9BACL|nr:sce7726 family protein [Brevibacillus thermoruber]MDA5111088.1 sce7726 family protein [Brevibacillus thermoruber]